MYLDEFENALNDFKKLESLIPNDPSVKNCYELLEQRKIEKHKKEQKLFKSFLSTKLYEDKNEIKSTVSNSNAPGKSIPLEINPNNPKVYFDLKVGDETELKRIEFELFKDQVPKTAENFRTFCKGYTTEENKVISYKSSMFHRIIKGFMMQGGDFENGNGTGGYSIYGKKFDDENFVYPHSQELLLSMANSGPNSNGSQFFITFKETPWLNGKHVVFGRVIKGHEHIKEIENVPCGENDVPTISVMIVDCGEFD